MIEGLTFKVAHDTSPKATPAEGHRNMNACQLRDPLAKKPHPAAAHRLSIGNSDDQKPRGKDQVVARLVSKDRIDLGRRRRPTPIPTHDVLPIGPQGSLSKFRRRINRDHSRNAMRHSHARSLTTDRPVSRTMSTIDFRRANFRKVSTAAARLRLLVRATRSRSRSRSWWRRATTGRTPARHSVAARVRNSEKPTGLR